MLEENAPHGALRPQELESVYAISRVVAAAVDIDGALDQIIQITRKSFIFDNMVLYLRKTLDSFEPTFARIVGRGRSAEADVAWGENIACEVIEQGRVIIRKEELDGWQTNRLADRIFLGLPLRLGEILIGAIVFGRFGGPAYTPEQIYLAEYTADHIAQLFGRQQLVERIANLEAEKRLNLLQADFIAMVSHELCTPLGFIKGYATTLLRADISWDEATRREFLSIIDEEADHLRELIDSLLDSSRLQAGTLAMNFQPVRLDTLLRDIALRSGERYPGLSIEKDLTPNVIVRADPTRLAQVFDNLVSNAVKYAPGSVVIFTLETLEDKIHATVKDRGPGIPAEYVEHIFKRFYRVPSTQSNARGTGLGLFICQHIIRAHDGEISAESILGEGTTFHIYLPLLNADEKPGDS